MRACAHLKLGKSSRFIPVTYVTMGILRKRSKPYNFGRNSSSERACEEREQAAFGVCGCTGQKELAVSGGVRGQGSLGHRGERKHRGNIQDFINVVVLPRAALEASSL